MGQGVSVQDLISIIVPVYNTEKYLDQCIQSVLTQTYTYWELLLIDDGSTDSSGTICDRYAAQDSRIKVIHKKNTGVSDSKNKALGIAQGEYIMFLDSDDYWCIDNCLEQLIGTSKRLNADIVRGEYIAVDSFAQETFRANHLNKIQFTNRILESSCFIDLILKREFFLWLCLFKKSTIKDIRFNKTRIFLEDLELFTQILITEPRCTYIPIFFYSYRKHPESISAHPKDKKLQDAFDIAVFYLDMAEKTTNESLKFSFKRRATTYYILTCKTIGEFSNFYSRHKKLSQQYHLKELNKRCRQTRSNLDKWYYHLLLYISPNQLITFWHRYLKARKIFN